MFELQKVQLEGMFIQCVQDYQNPLFEEDKAKNKELADQMKAVLRIFGYSQNVILELIAKANK